MSIAGIVGLSGAARSRIDGDNFSSYEDEEEEDDRDEDEDDDDDAPRVAPKRKAAAKTSPKASGGALGKRSSPAETRAVDQRIFAAFDKIHKKLGRTPKHAEVAEEAGVEMGTASSTVQRIAVALRRRGLMAETPKKAAPPPAKPARPAQKRKVKAVPKRRAKVPSAPRPIDVPQFSPEDLGIAPIAKVAHDPNATIRERLAEAKRRYVNTAVEIVGLSLLLEPVSG